MIISQLEQALRKCSPVKTEILWTGRTNQKLEYCVFCPGWKIYGKHDETCEYMNLINMTGGSNNER